MILVLKLESDLLVNSNGRGMVLVIFNEFNFVGIIILRVQLVWYSLFNFPKNCSISIYLWLLKIK